MCACIRRFLSVISLTLGYTHWMNAISLIAGGGIAERLKCPRVVVSTNWVVIVRWSRNMFACLRRLRLTEGSKWYYGDWYKHNCSRLSCDGHRWPDMKRRISDGPLEACQICLPFLAATQYIAVTGSVLLLYEAETLSNLSRATPISCKQTGTCNIPPTASSI